MVWDLKWCEFLQISRRHSRRIGKTSTAISLAQKSNGVLVCLNSVQAKEISQKHKIKTVSIKQNPACLQGLSDPIIFDQDSSTELIIGLSWHFKDEISSLRKEIKELYKGKEALGLTHPNKYIREIFTSDNS